MQMPETGRVTLRNVQQQSLNLSARHLAWKKEIRDNTVPLGPDQSVPDADCASFQAAMHDATAKKTMYRHVQQDYRQGLTDAGRQGSPRPPLRCDWIQVCAVPSRGP